MHGIERGTPSNMTRSIVAAFSIVFLGMCGVPAVAGEPLRVKAVHIRLTNGATVMKLQRQLERARGDRADLVVFEFAGEAEEATSVAWHDAIRQIGWAKTAAVCTSHLEGGALFAALACDDFLAAPDAQLGPLTTMAGKPLADPAAIRQRVVAAQKDHRRAVAVGLAMLDPHADVLCLKHRKTGARRYLSPAEWDAAGDPTVERVVERLAEFGAGAPVRLSGKRAHEYRLASGLAVDLDAALERLGVAGPMATLSETWVDDVAGFLNHPAVSILLVVAGLGFVYLEFVTAGVGLATLPACLCFLLFFWSRALGGGVGWLEVVLFLAGVVCLLLEIFVIPGFGVVGVTGLLLMLASIVMASQGFVWPRSAVDWQTLGNTTLQLAAAGVVVAGMLIGASRRMQQSAVAAMQLQTEAAPPTSAIAGLANAVGVSVTCLRPAGRIKVGEHDVDAVSNGFFIPAGARIRVLEAAGNRVVVAQA